MHALVIDRLDGDVEAAARALADTLGKTPLATELRQRCPQAAWDERLMRRAAQQQLLGPTLGADEHLDLAIALVAASARIATHQSS